MFGFLNLFIGNDIKEFFPHVLLWTCMVEGGGAGVVFIGPLHACAAYSVAVNSLCRIR